MDADGLDGPDVAALLDGVHLLRRPERHRDALALVLEPAGGREAVSHPGGNPGANLKSIAHRCHLREVACVWELTKETIYLPLGCLQGGASPRCLKRQR